LTETQISLPEEPLVEQAEQALQEAVSLLRQGRAYYIAFGLKALDLHSMGAWEYLGFDSFKEMCYAPIESSGLDTDSKAVYHAMRVAETFVLKLGVSDGQLASIDHSKLKLLQPIATEKNVEKMIHDAEMLTVADLRKRRLEGAYGGKKEKPLDATKEPVPPGVHGEHSWKGTKFALEYEGMVILELTADEAPWKGLTSKIARLLNENPEGE